MTDNVTQNVTPSFALQGCTFYTLNKFNVVIREYSIYFDKVILAMHLMLHCFLDITDNTIRSLFNIDNDKD